MSKHGDGYDTNEAKSLFAERLNTLMERQRFRKRDLAKRLGLQESTVGKWALGKTMPRTMGMIEKVAVLLGVEKSYFLERENTQKESSLSFREKALLLAYQSAPESGKKEFESLASKFLP